MKKTIIVLCMILAAGLIFAGGGSQGTRAVADDPSAKYTFSFATLNWGQIHGTEFNTDDVSMHLRNKFNFEWDVIQNTWTDWVTNPRIWINSMDMPDMVWTDFSYADYSTFLEQDLIKRFPAGWKEKYPSLAKVFIESGLGPELEKRLPGEQAVIPNIASMNFRQTSPRLATHASIWFRKDWATALGMPIKDHYTLKEFTGMVEKFNAEGMSLPGVTRGRTDPWNLSASSLPGAYIISQWPYANGFYKNDSGRYAWGPDDPRTFELLTYMKEAVSRGVISPNFASYKNEEEHGYFYTGQAFAMYGHGWIEYASRYRNEFQAATGLDPFECLHQTVLTDENGYYQQIEQPNYWSCIYFNPKMSDAKFARLLSLLDYIASPEGQSYIRMGFEGKDYIRNGSQITITRPRDENGNFRDIHAMYPVNGILSHITIVLDDFASMSPAIPQRYFESVYAMYATKQRIGVDTGTVRALDYDMTFFNGPNFLRRPTTTTVNQDFVRIAMMDGDLRTNYNNWIRDMRPVVDPVLAELNAAFGR